MARVALVAISDQTKRDFYVSEAFIGAQWSLTSWKSDGFNPEGIFWIDEIVSSKIFILIRHEL